MVTHDGGLKRLNELISFKALQAAFFLRKYPLKYVEISYKGLVQ